MHRRKTHSIEHAFSGIPSQERKTAKQTMKLLIRERFIVTKQTPYGLQISLDPEKIKDIRELLK